MSSPADLRREYASRALTEADAHEDPIQQFSLWFGEALQAELRALCGERSQIALMTVHSASLSRGFDICGRNYYRRSRPTRGGARG